MNIDAKTLICATLANPNRTTKAPIMYNAAFKELGLNYAYVAFEPDDIGQAMHAVRAFKMPGVSVSTPYKQAVMEFLDEIDPTAKKIGAVNAVKNNNGRLIGYNCDWMGAVGALEEVCSLKNKKVALLGAGGAARAVAFGLIKKGAKVTLFNRTEERGRKLAADLGANFGGDLKEVTKFAPEILVNATSIDSKSKGFVQVEESVFSTVKIVMDIVTHRTPLLESADKHGCTTVEGIRMLVLQGAFTFELLTGKKAPVDVMFNAVVSAHA